MSDFRDPTNPYATPTYSAFEVSNLRERVSGRVIAPAICLCILSVLGLGMAIFNVGYAFTEHKIDPNAPEFLRNLQQGAVGPLAAAIQAGFVVLNLLILLGSIQMMRIRTWALAMAASIMAMLNFSSCCCIPGIPVGIWSLIILSQSDVRAAFEMIDQH